MSLAAKALLLPVLVAQGLATRARLPRLPEPEGERDGVAGAGPALRLLVAGDSSAAGVGVVHQRDALAHRLAQELAARCHHRVHWRLLARSGLNSADTLALLETEDLCVAGRHPDLAVVVTGVNDVVDQVPTRRALAAREALANRLRNGHGVGHVAFAPLPPVHRFPGLPQPLRWVAGADARRHDRALAEWVATRGDVSRVEIELPLNAGLMAGDGFHPGPQVYRICAHAIAVHLATLLGARQAPGGGWDTRAAAARGGVSGTARAAAPRARPRRASSR